jgi:hypothetical protein
VRSRLMFIFNLKFILNLNFFKMATVRVQFSPGFPLRGGFPAEQNTHMVLCVNRIPPEQKNRFPEVLLRILNTTRANTRQFALWEIHFSAEIRIPPEQLSWNTLLQRAVEFRRSNLSSTPAASYHHAGANCSAGNPPPRGNTELKGTRTEAI